MHERGERESEWMVREGEREFAGKGGGCLEGKKMKKNLYLTVKKVTTDQ